MTNNYDELVMHGFGGDDYLLYRFDRKEGVLQLPMNERDLEKLLKKNIKWRAISAAKS